MPLVRTALIAAAACLLGGVAFAQTDNSPQADQAPPPAAPTGGEANASATVNSNGVITVASQPVPDTPANRKAYGQPLSRAGKRTAPKGN
jgi:hypothetical protein